jgi:prepilin-type N-terminal cleavage/methylation domain-containing protein
MKKNKGFTLIEILMVIGLLSIIGTIAVTVITITLRSAKKTDLLNFANQNGDAALSQMVKNIRYAQTLNSPATCVPTTTVSSITITSFSDHQQTTYSCAGNTISSNSASLLDTNSLTVSSCSFVCSQSSALVPPIITIQYVLAPKTAGNFADSNFSLPFQSSVTLRNY